MMYAVITSRSKIRLSEFPCVLNSTERVQVIGTHDEMQRLVILGSQLNVATGYVYLMYDERTALIKIGYSIKPKYRERTLQSDNPLITLLATFPGHRSDETYLHNHFRHFRKRGEWFDLSERDIRFIEKRMYSLQYQRDLQQILQADFHATIHDVPAVTYSPIDCRSLNIEIDF